MGHLLVCAIRTPIGINQPETHLCEEKPYNLNSTYTEDIIFGNGPTESQPPELLHRLPLLCMYRGVTTHISKHGHQKVYECVLELSFYLGMLGEDS